MANYSNHPSGKGVRGPHSEEHKAAIALGVQRAYHPEALHDGWELVHGQPYNSAGYVPATHRMAVPGGWLYHYQPFASQVLMCFVPRP